MQRKGEAYDGPFKVKRIEPELHHVCTMPIFRGDTPRSAQKKGPKAPPNRTQEMCTGEVIQKTLVCIDASEWQFASMPLSATNV